MYLSDKELRELSTPQRFRVLGYLCKVEIGNYPGIQKATGLSTPDISRTVKFLESHEYVAVSKGLKGRYSQTVVAATSSGRKAMKALVKDLQRFFPNQKEPPDRGEF